MIRLPVAYQAAEHALADLVAAIELVASGQARRVVISGIPGDRGGGRRGAPTSAGRPRRVLPAAYAGHQPWRSSSVPASRDRGSPTAPRSEGGGPARPGRAPALAVLPLHRARHAHREGGRVGRAPGAARPAVTARRFVFGRPLSNEEEAFERLPKKLALADLQLGRDQLVRLRDRGDPAGPRAGRDRRPHAVARGRDRDRDPPDGRVDLVPPGLPRLPVRRRSLRRRP